MLKSAFQVLAAFLVVAIAATMGLQVFQRFVLNQSLPWPDELIGNLLAILSFVGAVLAIREDEHVRVRLVETMLSTRKALPLRLLADMFSVGFLLTVAWVSWPIVLRMWRIDLTTLALPVGLFMAAVPVCCVAMSFYIMRDAWLTIRCSTRTEESAEVSIK